MDGIEKSWQSDSTDSRRDLGRKRTTFLQYLDVSVYVCVCVLSVRNQKLLTVYCPLVAQTQFAARSNQHAQFVGFQSKH